MFEKASVTAQSIKMCQFCNLFLREKRQPDQNIVICIKILLHSNLFLKLTLVFLLIDLAKDFLVVSWIFF